jgi:hypothetical protein
MGSAAVADNVIDPLPHAEAPVTFGAAEIGFTKAIAAERKLEQPFDTASA